MHTRLAAIDLGSNSFRLEIGRVENDEIVCEHYCKEGVRLAAGLDEHGALTEESQQKALETLERFHQKIKNFSPEHVRAVGTQTIRVAQNNKEFLLRAQRVLGFPIEILPGQEEARLVFEGCSHRLPLSDKKRLVIDVGGGSTELVTGRVHHADRCESFHVGCVNLSLQYFPSGVITREGYEAAKLAAMAEFQEGRERFNSGLWDEAYGSSGSMEAVCSLAKSFGFNSHAVTKETLCAIRDRMIAAGHVSKLNFPDLHHSRRDVITGGLAVLHAACDALNIKELRFSEGALRLGLLYEQLSRLKGVDLRENSTWELLKYSKVSEAQAKRVSQIALLLLKRLYPQAPDSVLKRLHWAALLHETGNLISHNRFHRLGAYLVEHFDLQGFSINDRHWVSQLVLGHRGRLYKIESQLSDPDWAKSLLALRLASIIAHKREDLELPEFELMQPEERHWRLSFRDSDWLTKHPLTHFLLQREVEAWKAVQYQFDFEK